MSAAGVLGKLGSLITTDVPTKQLLVFINRENGNKIILQDLDDTHVLVDSRYVQYLKDEVARLLEKNMYDTQTQLSKQRG